MIILEHIKQKNHKNENKIKNKNLKRKKLVRFYTYLINKMKLKHKL